MSTTRQSSGSPESCRLCEEPVANKKHELCKAHENAIRVWAHRNGVEFSKAVAMRVNGYEPQMGRPPDDDRTAVRKHLAGNKTRFTGAKTFKAQNFGWVEVEGPDKPLAHVAKNSRMGNLGGLHRDSTATTLHRTKPQKLEGSPPKLSPTQKYGPRIVTSVWQRPLDWRTQGRHKHGGGAMLMGYVPDHCRRETGPRVQIGGVWVRKTPRTCVTLEPLVLPRKADMLARYEGTKRLHSLGWLPPSGEREDDESGAVLAELVPDPNDT